MLGTGLKTRSCLRIVSQLHIGHAQRVHYQDSIGLVLFQFVEAVVKYICLLGHLGFGFFFNGLQLLELLPTGLAAVVMEHPSYFILALLILPYANKTPKDAR